MDADQTPANENLAKASNPVHEKLGEMFAEIAGKGTLTPELASIYVTQLVKMPDEHAGRDEAVLRIHGMFEGDDETQAHIFSIAETHTSGNQKNLMKQLFERSKPRIAAMETPQQRIGALEWTANCYQMPHKARVAAFTMAVDELDKIEDPEQRFSATTSLLSTLTYEGRVIEADAKTNLIQRVEDKAFEIAQDATEPAVSLEMYKKIHGMHRLSNATKNRALADVVDFVIDRLETPQEAYEAADWVKETANAGSELRNRMIDEMPSYVKALPTVKDRMSASRSQYYSVSNSYWQYGGTDYQNPHSRALMDASLDIFAYNAPRAEHLANRVSGMASLYAMVQYNHRDRKEKVIRSTMALIDRQPTLTEQKAALDYLLEECRPDHRAQGYELRGTLKGAALKKRDQIEEKIAARAEKTPELNPGQFEQFVSGFVPKTPD